VRVLTRRGTNCGGLSVLPDVEIVEVPTLKSDAWRGQFVGAYAVVNLVGILNEERDDGVEFQRVHVTLATAIAEAAKADGVKRFLHMSALRAGEGTSFYSQSKGEGEERVHALSGGGFSIASFRPSVIFGPEDKLCNRFAALLRVIPWIFPVACPQARFQPVYVGDVVETMLRALAARHFGGQRYELVGPEVCTLVEIVAYCQHLLGTKQRIWPLADEQSRLLAQIMDYVPGKPFSLDNYRACQVDNVATGVRLTQEQLGVRPTSMDAVIPGYLGGLSSAWRLDEMRRNARRGP
jgi:NADH dehydrogenase